MYGVVATLPVTTSPRVSVSENERCSDHSRLFVQCRRVHPSHRATMRSFQGPEAALALHFINAATVCGTLIISGRGRWWTACSLLSSLAFLVHPLSTELVLWGTPALSQLFGASLVGAWTLCSVRGRRPMWRMLSLAALAAAIEYFGPAAALALPLATVCSDIILFRPSTGRFVDFGVGAVMFARHSTRVAMMAPPFYQWLSLLYGVIRELLLPSSVARDGMFAGKEYLVTALVAALAVSVAVAGDWSYGRARRAVATWCAFGALVVAAAGLEPGRDAVASAVAEGIPVTLLVSQCVPESWGVFDPASGAYCAAMLVATPVLASTVWTAGRGRRRAAVIMSGVVTIYASICMAGTALILIDHNQTSGSGVAVVSSKLDLGMLWLRGEAMLASSSHDRTAALSTLESALSRIENISEFSSCRRSLLLSRARALDSLGLYDRAMDDVESALGVPLTERVPGAADHYSLATRALGDLGAAEILNDLSARKNAEATFRNASMRLDAALQGSSTGGATTVRRWNSLKPGFCKVANNDADLSNWSNNAIALAEAWRIRSGSFADVSKVWGALGSLREGSAKSASRALLIEAAASIDCAIVAARLIPDPIAADDMLFLLWMLRVDLAFHSKMGADARMALREARRSRRGRTNPTSTARPLRTTTLPLIGPRALDVVRATTELKYEEAWREGVALADRWLDDTREARAVPRRMVAMMLLQRGVLQQRLGRHEAAERSFESATGEDAAWSIPRILEERCLSQFHFASHAATDTCAAVMEVLPFERKSVEVLNVLGVIKAQTEGPESGLAIFERAVQQAEALLQSLSRGIVRSSLYSADAHSQAHGNLGTVMWELGHLDLAKHQFKLAVRLYENEAAKQNLAKMEELLPRLVEGTGDKTPII